MTPIDDPTINCSAASGRARDRARRRESRGARRVSIMATAEKTEGHTWLRIDLLEGGRYVGTLRAVN